MYTGNELRRLLGVKWGFSSYLEEPNFYEAEYKRMKLQNNIILDYPDANVHTEGTVVHIVHRETDIEPELCYDKYVYFRLISPETFEIEKVTITIRSYDGYCCEYNSVENIERKEITISTLVNDYGTLFFDELMSKTLLTSYQVISLIPR